MASNVTFNNTEELYSGLFENRSSKIFFVLVSFVIDLVNIALAYGVIWYDHFGVDLKRTLMNKLVTSICWAAIIDVPLIQLFEIPRYFWGPQPAIFCFVQSFLKNSIKWQILLLLDASVLARYIFIFWLKNPSAVHDDFWSVFINLWIAGLSVISNFVLFSRPGGKMPIHYYVCANVDPALESHLPSSGGFIDVFSILLHLLIKVRITWYTSNKVVKPAISCTSNQVNFNPIKPISRKKRKSLIICFSLSLPFLSLPFEYNTQILLIILKCHRLNV